MDLGWVALVVVLGLITSWFYRLLVDSWERIATLERQMGVTTRHFKVTNDRVWDLHARLQTLEKADDDRRLILPDTLPKEGTSEAEYNLWLTKEFGKA